MATPLHKNPCPGGHEIYNFGLDPSSVIITIHFSALCLGVEKNIFKEIMNFHPIRKPPVLGVMKFTILVDPSLVIMTLYLVCLKYAWEKRFQKKSFSSLLNL